MSEFIVYTADTSQPDSGATEVGRIIAPTLPIAAVMLWCDEKWGSERVAAFQRGEELFVERKD